MYVCAEVRPLGPQEIFFRRRALRDAVVCIGWLKFFSILCYILLFLLTYAYSKGRVAIVIQVMILAILPGQVLSGVLLFMGALERKSLALDLAIWLILFIAAYNTVLGMLGCVYFIRVGFLPMHFFLAIFFAFLAFSVFTVLCHDIVIIYTLSTLLKPTPRNRQNCQMPECPTSLENLPNSRPASP